MANKTLTFAIFGNTFQSRKSMPLSKAVGHLRSRGMDIALDRQFYDFIAAQRCLDMTGIGIINGDDFTADYAISMGGDGTFLKSAMRVGRKAIPLIGINMGRLGFLANVLPDDTEAALDAVIEGRYDIDRHSVIEIATSGGSINGCRYALNDIAVLKRDNASMISIRTHVDNCYLTTYQADGLIVSTPTGSTAYSLSNGGPIIVPQTSTVCLTPVAPHSLNVRPIVIADSSVVRLEVLSRSHNYLVAVDGRSYTMHEGSVVTISKAPFSTLVVKPQDSNYFASLRDKMMWGADKR